MRLIELWPPVSLRNTSGRISCPLKRHLIEVTHLAVEYFAARPTPSATVCEKLTAPHRRHSAGVGDAATCTR